MWKSFFFVPCLLCAYASYAQCQAWSVLREGKCWTMLHEGVLPPEYGYSYSFHETRLDGEILIEGKHFKRKECRSWRAGESKPEEWTPTNEYIAEEDGRIYICSMDGDGNRRTVYMTMDLNASAGDIVNVGPPGSGDTYTVTSVSSEIPIGSGDQKQRRKLQVRYKQSEFTDTWIEGIGSLTFGVSSTIPSPGVRTNLYKCEDSGTVLYRMSS